MSEVVTAEQIEAFRTNGFVVIDDLLTDAELDTFEPLLTPADAYPLGQRRAHAQGTLAPPAVVRQADVAGESSSADNKPSSSSAISCSPRPRSLTSITRFRTPQWISILILTRDRLARDRSVVLVAAWAAA